MSRNSTINFLLYNFIINDYYQRLQWFHRGRTILNHRKTEQELLELARVSAYVRFALGMSRGSVYLLTCTRVQRSGVDVLSVTRLRRVIGSVIGWRRARKSRKLGGRCLISAVDWDAIVVTRSSVSWFFVSPTSRDAFQRPVHPLEFAERKAQGRGIERSANWFSSMTSNHPGRVNVINTTRGR